MLQVIALLDSFRLPGIKISMGEIRTTKDRLMNIDEIEVDLTNSINKIRGIEPIALKKDK